MQNAIEQAQLDFDAPVPSAAHEDARGEAADVFPVLADPGFATGGDAILAPGTDSPFAVGDSVWLRGCVGAGQPGRVLRHEGRKEVCYWPDLDFLSRHVPASLMLAGDAVSGPIALPPTNTGLPAPLAALLEQVDEGGL
jgi:hypothetical protein